MQIPAWWEEEYIWVDLVRGSPAGRPDMRTKPTRKDLPTRQMLHSRLVAWRRCREPTPTADIIVLTGKGEGQIRINPLNAESWIDVPGSNRNARRRYLSWRSQLFSHLAARRPEAITM